MVDQEDILALVNGGSVQDVKDLASYAARQGQKQLAINLYRCLVKIGHGSAEVAPERLFSLSRRPIEEPVQAEMADA